MGYSRTLFRGSGVPFAGRSDAGERGGLWELPGIFAGAGQGARTLHGAEGGGVPGAEVVHGLWSGVGPRGTAEECRAGAAAAGDVGEFDGPDVRRLQRLGRELRGGVGEAGGAIPAAVDRRGGASGEDRELRDAAAEYVGAGGVGRT